MKVTFQYGLAGYTGKLDGLVFCNNRELGKAYARKYRYPRLTEGNERIGSVTSALFALKPSKAYQDDMYLYRKRYNALRENSGCPVRSWSAMYLKLMYRMVKADGSIDLRTLTREELYARKLPCISVKMAVEAGLLPAVYAYTELTHEL